MTCNCGFDRGDFEPHPEADYVDMGQRPPSLWRGLTI